MATRLYLPGSGAAPISPAFDAAWDQTTGADRLMAYSGKTNTAMANRGQAETRAAESNVLLRQYIAGPLVAQTISGTIKGQVRASESNAAADMRAQMVVRVVSRDGSTVRGTLRAADGEALSSELNTSLRNVTLPLAALAPEALTSVAAQDGDWLVIEFGYRAHNTVTTSYTGTMAFGDNAADDLAEDETTTTANNPWIEFSQDIGFMAQVTQLVAETLHIDAEPPVRATQLVAEALILPATGETLELQGAIRGETALSGALDVVVPRYLVGAMTADTQTDGTMRARMGLSGDAKAGAATSARLAALYPLFGGMKDTAALSGTLSCAIGLTGSLENEAQLSARLALLHLLYAKSVAEVSPKAYLNAARALAGSILGNTRLAGRLKSGQIMLLLGLLAEDTSITGRAQVDRGVAGQIEQESTAGGNLAIDRGLRGTMRDEPDWTGAMSAHYGLTGGLEQALDTNARLNLRMWLLGEIENAVTINGQMFKRPHLKFPVSLIPEAHLTTLRVEPHEDNVTVEIHAKEVNV